MVGKKLINHSLIYGLASLLINGSNFFLIPFYTHYLTTSEYGIISSVTLFSTIATVFMTFGLNGAVTRFFVEYNETEFKEFIFSIFAFQILTSAIICTVFVLCNGLFLDDLFNNVRYDPYIKYGLFISFFGMFSAIPLAVLQVQTKALLYRIYTTASFTILTILMMYFIVKNGDGGIGGVRASLYASLIMAIFYSILVFRNSKVHFKLTYLTSALAFSLPIMIYSVFGSLVDISSKFFIEKLVSLSELGVYNVAQQMAALILLLTNAVNMAWVPIFFEEAKKNQNSKVFEGFGNLLIYGLTTSGLIVCMFSQEFVHLFMPASYLDVSVYIPYLIFAYIIGGYWVLLVNPITFVKKTIYLPVISVLSGAFAVLTNWLLVPWLGVSGAALSTLVGYVIQVVIAYFIMKRYSSIKYNFGKMNAIIGIGILFYMLSTLVALENLSLNITIKLTMVVLYYFLLRYLKIYSIVDVQYFVKNKFH